MPNSNDLQIERLVQDWRVNEDIGPNVAQWKTNPASAPKCEPMPNDLAPNLAQLLTTRGIQTLYAHQASTWHHAQAGHHVVIVTGTGSGKTLCFALPIMNRLEADAESRALILYPTRALAHDQVASFTDLFGTANGKGKSKVDKQLPIATYDGDTPSSARRRIREQARIVVANPDMLHLGMLPHHTDWEIFFQHLNYVVIDEMQTYRGVFGSHVANVLRRLKRIAKFYGASPQFIMTSATIGNPTELADKLIEEEVHLVQDDGSAKGAKHFLIFNPPIVNQSLGIRRSAELETSRLVLSLLSHDIQAIVFARARRTVELLLKYLSTTPAALEGQVRGYRGGYLSNERREIEQGLRTGEVRVVVATNALEPGIDIGGMGAAIMVGYPGSVSATLQQAGRAGRKGNSSIAVLVASMDPLDQYLTRHPSYLFDRGSEQALIDPDNLMILYQHLRCAAFELQFEEGENFGRVPGSRVDEFMQLLVNANILHHSGKKYYFVADQYPADSISLRSASAERVVLEVDGKTVGEVDYASSLWMVHPNAIYLHEARSYSVDSLDLETKIARLRPVEVDYYTEPRNEVTTRLLDKFAGLAVPGGTKSHGEIAVTTQVVGYRKLRWLTRENLGQGEVSLPPTELHTTAYWITLAEDTVERLREEGMWSSDTNDYGPDWPMIRNMVRARDNYRCQNCDAPESGREHPVHHKVPFRFFASEKEANRMGNLVTLCGKCHPLAEAVVRLRSGLAGASHVLRHLAPLFLMCDARDIGVHSDPESPLSMGRPALAIYDNITNGVGFSERLFALHAELMRRGQELVSECSCDDGCPSCVGPGGEYGYGGKRETLALLTALKI